MGLAECYHALGDWVAGREPWYLTAAKYEYLNAAVEAPYVWGRLATLYLDWGDSLFRDDDAAAAKAIYETVLADRRHRARDRSLHDRGARAAARSPRAT